MSAALRNGSVPSQDTLQKIIAGIFTDDAQTKQQYLSIIGLLYQVGINVGIGAGAFLVFVFLRPKNQRVYGRRYKALQNDERRPPKIGRGLFEWVAPLWRADERFLLDTVDLDSVFFLRFMKLGMWLMGIFGFLGMCIIVPVNFSNGNNENVTGNLKEFALLWITLYHITNLNVFALHVVAAYVFTAIFFYFIVREYKHYARAKQDYFASPQYLRKLQSRTIMVSRLPPDLQSDNALHSFIASRSSGTMPTQVSIARKIGELQELVDKHEQSVRKLEQVLSKYLAGDYQSKPRPKIKVAGAQVDAIEHYTLEIESLESTINQARLETETFKATSIGFVSYASPQMAHDALRSLKSVGPAMVSMAPHPKDIIWSNAQMPKSKRLSRLWMARLISVVICFIAFWPVAALTFIGSAVNIQILWRNTTDFFTRHNTLTTIWQNTFSPLILALYYIMMPHIFRAISRYQGISTHTAVERSVLKNMYVFYFLSNLIVFTLIGVIVNAVLDKTSFKETMSDLAHNFVQSLNQKAQFWTAYVSLKMLNAMLEFAQLISLSLIFIKRYTRNLTPRELRDLTKPPDFDYSPVYSLYLWVFTISMFYSVYSPIALPFAFLDYVLAYWVYKYAIMYVYQTRHDTAGAMWRNVIDRMIASMVIFQVYLICCLKVRIDMFSDHLSDVHRVQPIVYSLIPLPVMTLGFGIYLHRWLNAKVNYMQPSVDVDMMPEVRKLAEEDAKAEDTLGDRFLHPTFSQSLATPMVDRRIKHLLPRVYRGRLSISGAPGTIRRAGMGDGESKFGTSIGNASTLFGSEALDTDTMMDARDRRDFDGAATPVPVSYSGTGMTMVGGKGLMRSYSVDSNVSHGDTMEMRNISRHRGDSASSSQADLLGHVQGISSHTSDLSDREHNEMMLMRSNSSVNRYGGAMGARINHGAAEYDAVDLYGEPMVSAGTTSDMYMAPYSASSNGGGSASGQFQHQQQQQQGPTMRAPAGFRPSPSQPHLQQSYSQAAVNPNVSFNMSNPSIEAIQNEPNPGRYANSAYNSRPSPAFGAQSRAQSPPGYPAPYQREPAARMMDPPRPRNGYNGPAASGPGTDYNQQQQQRQQPPQSQRNVPRWD